MHFACQGSPVRIPPNLTIFQSFSIYIFQSMPWSIIVASTKVNLSKIQGILMRSTYKKKEKRIVPLMRFEHITFWFEDQRSSNTLIGSLWFWAKIKQLKPDWTVCARFWRRIPKMKKKTKFKTLMLRIQSKKGSNDFLTS